MAFNNGSVTYICFDCGKSTGGVQTVLRGRITTYVCRKGSGCHKDTNPYDQPVAVDPVNVPLPPRIIKVAVYVVVEVDVAQLEAEYGHEFTNAEARDDVKQSMRGAAITASYPSHANDKIITRVLA
jgi:hypothetical protein